MTETTAIEADAGESAAVTPGRGHPPARLLRGVGSDRRLALWVAACAVAFVVATMGTSLIGRTTQTVTDLLNSYEPWYAEQTQDWTFPGTWFGDHVNVLLPTLDEFASRLRSGDLAWWSPYNSGGAPLAGVGDDSVFSPLVLPYMVLPLWLAPAYAHLLVIGVTVAGMVLLLRRLGLSHAAGLLGGFAFATSGFMYMWLQWPQTRIAALLPWLFWSVERAIQVRRAVAAIPVALVTAIMYLGFFPPLMAQCMLAAGVYLLARLWVERRRRRRQELVQTAAVVGTGVLLGVALVAWLVLPLLNQVSGLDLTYREQTSTCHAPAKSVVSLVFPRYGSSPDFEFVCPQGEHETETFAGVMVVGLAGLGLLTRGKLPGGARGYFAGLGATVAMLVFLGGPGLWLLQHLPVFDLNRITRLRVLLGFAIAVFAACGFDRLVQYVRDAGTSGRRLLAALAGLFVVVAVVLLRVRDWHDIPMPALGGWVPVVACLVTAGVLLAAGARHPGWRRLALYAVPIVITVEAVAAIGPYWPRGDPDDLYAETSTSDFLQEHIGADRYGSSLLTFFVNSNRVFGLRAVTGRGFFTDEWDELIDTAHGRDVGLRSASILSELSVEDLGSPIFDRMAMRYYVTSTTTPVLGPIEFLGPPSGPVEIAPGESTMVGVTGPLRGIGLDLPTAPDVGGERPRLRAELVDRAGRVLATGWRRLYPGTAAGPLTVAVPGDLATATAAVRLTLVDAERPLAVNGAAGGPAAAVVRSADDGVRLVHADGTVIYGRLHALPRIRWAPDAVVEPDRTRRLGLLDDPSLPAETVVLSGAGPAADGRPARIRVRDDHGDGDTIRMDVDASGRGYVVVADAIQKGWHAELDGRAVELRDADHAMVAVAVPQGRHELTLAYEPPGQRAGFLIAGAAALALVAIGAWELRRRRRAQADGAAAGGPS